MAHSDPVTPKQKRYLADLHDKLGLPYTVGAATRAGATAVITDLEERLKKPTWKQWLRSQGGQWPTDQNASKEFHRIP